MQVVPFEFKHLNQYNGWLLDWKAKPVPASFFPEIGGFIVENHCAAFLYLTNTSMAFYENIAVNPKSTDEERKEAINLVDDAIAEFARKHKVITILGRSNNQSLLQRGKDNGWEISNKTYNMMYKNLEGNK